MKAAFCLIPCLFLVSCNTSIGLWRDAKVGYKWTEQKIRNANSGGHYGGENYDYDLPVY